MTAHRTKPIITPERIAWFTAYHRKHTAWGAFHGSLDDGNYRHGACDPIGEPGEQEAIEWFNQLSPSQRRRLALRC